MKKSIVWSIGVIWGVLFCFSSLAGAQEGPVTGASLSTGVTKVYNRTRRAVTVRAQSYVAADGFRRGLGGSWRIDPGVQTVLAYDGQSLIAHRFDYALASGGPETTWYSEMGFGDDGTLALYIDDAELTPYSSSTGWVGGEDGATVRQSFATPAGPQTLVFTAATPDGFPNVLLEVRNRQGIVVAQSNQRDNDDSSRCMLSTMTQDSYVLRISAAGAAQTSFRLRTSAISHLNVLADAVSEQMAKALVGELAVVVLGDQADQRAYTNELKQGAKKDALALAVIEGFMQMQRAVPDADPRSVSQLVSRLGGSDDDRFVDVRRDFVDRLVARIRTASKP